MESEFRFLDFSTAEFEINFPTGIFGIENGIRILLLMGVPEIGTENWNSQPSLIRKMWRRYMPHNSSISRMGEPVQAIRLINEKQLLQIM